MNFDVDSEKYDHMYETKKAMEKKTQRIFL